MQVAASRDRLWLSLSVSYPTAILLQNLDCVHLWKALWLRKSWAPPQPRSGAGSESWQLKLITQLVIPFPLPVIGSGKEVKWSEVTQSCPTLCEPMDCSLLCSSVHGIFQARELEWVAISFSRGFSSPRDRTQVSRTVGRHFTIWATRDSKNKNISLSCFFGREYGKDTGVGCHSLLQELFPTQGLNLGLPHYRQMVYCLSHQGSQEKKCGAILTKD